MNYLRQLFVNGIIIVFIGLIVVNEMESFLDMRDMRFQLKQVQYDIQSVTSNRGHKYV